MNSRTKTSEKRLAVTPLLPKAGPFQYGKLNKQSPAATRHQSQKLQRTGTIKYVIVSILEPGGTAYPQSLGCCLRQLLSSPLASEIQPRSSLEGPSMLSNIVSWSGLISSDATFVQSWEPWVMTWACGQLVKGIPSPPQRLGNSPFCGARSLTLARLPHKILALKLG